ncbi:hypothetical protein FEZ18_06075 [Oceanihabitans sp. IOP_32]|uniref:membrane lipoprotein lipid attachment site-containing protein n=1 Tax=Oceanihabitans sp. IOP_32 TaxID=2529032 RepID=UPI0012934291|nr:membrane lipoprotein lipid attachment site-containing protein [Oceanihabitans sp. IOP_32]QFZ54389.1 hypothetical protein FEZ18_06075 [Oceanihabitans sp. IOP_32]
MKKFIVLSLALFVLASCSLDDDRQNYRSVFLPIESVDIPDEFTLGKTYPITVSYLKPSTCHAFKEFYYLKKNNQRTVAVINYEYENNRCDTLTNKLVEATFNFVVTSNGSYIFKFWQEKDSTGEDQYLTIEVPVTN